MNKARIKINVLGSCVSRVSILDGVQSAHGIADDRFELGYFFDKQNMVCAMTPPPFSREEVEKISADELWDKSRIYSLKQSLNKDTVKLLLGSDADYLVIDFFDMMVATSAYRYTMFANQAAEFYNTALARKYVDEISLFNFMDIDGALWYPYVNLFMEQIMTKYDRNHIILNRFRCNRYFLDTSGAYGNIPDKFFQTYHPHYKYNDKLREFEDWFIQEFDPWVIDLSKYFTGDRNEWENLQGAHFEKEFYRETYDQIKRICMGKTDKRCFSEPDFFNDRRRGFEEDSKRKFDVEFGYEFLNMLVENNDLAWLGVLDKLWTYAPDDPRTVELMKVIEDE